MKNPKFVLLRGRPTSGKSTAFKNLKNNKELKDWFFIDHPVLKGMFNNLENNREIKKDALFGLLKGILKHKRNIILEEYSRPGLVKKIGYYLRKYDYKLIVFQFTIDTNIAYGREAERRKKKGKKPLGKKWIDEMHKMHDKRFDKKGILVDTKKLNQNKTVKFILDNLK